MTRNKRRAGITALGVVNVRKWVAHLRQHESRENELVQDAFNRDITAED